MTLQITLLHKQSVESAQLRSEASTALLIQKKTSELEIIADIAEILVFLRYLNVQHQQDTIRFNETWRKRTRDDSLPLARITH